jgi:hypothetical protein
MPSIEKMLEEVQGFVPHPVLLVSPEETEAQSSIPEAWIHMLRRQSEGIKSWMEPWKDFQNLLPGVYDFLQHKVHGVCVLLEEGKPPSLLYFYGRETDCYFYQGGPALGNKAPDNTRDIWRRLPARLQEFYSKVHNGWTTLSSMGPLPVEEIEFLSDHDWGDDETEELNAQLPFRLENVAMVFGNGGGDSLCLDLSLDQEAIEAHAIDWWHEDTLEPDLDENFWARMDEWICAQLEDVDLAE